MKIFNSLPSYALAVIIAIGISVPQSSNAQMSVTQMGFGNFKKEVYPYWYKKGWFIDAQGGMRILGATTADASLAPGFSINAGLGYRFSDRFALKGRIDYNDFGFEPTTAEPTYSGVTGSYEARGTGLSASFEAMINLITVRNKVANGTLKGNKAYKLDFHGGIGYTTFANRAFKDFFTDNFGSDFFSLDPLIRGNDDMGHVILGLTNSYDFNSRVSVNLDYSAFILIAQDYTFDSYNLVEHDGVGFISTISLGLTYRFL
jgi:hypothetical protein